MNSVIEAQRELEEQQLRLRLLELRKTLKDRKRGKQSKSLCPLVARAFEFNYVSPNVMFK
jgi:hypothetical protein